MSDFSLDWGLHPGVIALALLCAVVICARRAFPINAPVLGALRVCAFLALGAILLGPSIRSPRENVAGRPSVVLLIDDSLSMCTPDVEGATDQVRRIDSLHELWLEPNALAQLQRRSDLQLALVGEKTRPVSGVRAANSNPEGARSRLASAVREKLLSGDDRSPSHLVLLSDGVDTDDPSGMGLLTAADIALSEGVHVHTATFGDESSARNVAIFLRPDVGTILAGDQVALRARVAQNGFDGWPARVTIRRQPNAELVHQEEIQLGGPIELAIRVRPEARWSGADDLSIVTYEASIESLEGEATYEDNRATAHVQVTRDRIRVALFENRPSWESRFFSASLRADRRVELTTVFGVGRQREIVHRYNPGPAGGGSEERIDSFAERELDDYDVIVLGRGCERWFGGARASALRSFVVDRGGALILLRGNPVEIESPAGSMTDALLLEAAINDLAPVHWVDRDERSARSVVATPEGAVSGLLGGDPWETASALEGMPEMLGATRVDREKGLSVVWLRQRDGVAVGFGADDGAPALAHMQVGRGRVMSVLTSGFWRWAFQPDAFSGRRDLYRAFWGRTVAWLATGGEFLPGQRLSVAVEPTIAAPGDVITVSVRQRYFESGASLPTLSVLTPGGGRLAPALRREDPLSNEFIARFKPEEEGVYEVVSERSAESEAKASARAVTQLVVREDRTEILDVAARRSVMREIARRTGGAILDGLGPESLIEALEQATYDQSPTVRLEPVWDRWWIFTIIVGLLGTEWLLRRREGLL